MDAHRPFGYIASFTAGALKGCFNGANVRTPFPNNTVPLTRFDSVALAIQNMLPMPNAPGIINNYNIPSYTNFVHTTTYLREVCRKAGCWRSARPV